MRTVIQRVTHASVTIDGKLKSSAIESERTSRVIDKDGGVASMEKRKKEGYF